MLFSRYDGKMIDLDAKSMTMERINIGRIVSFMNGLIRPVVPKIVFFRNTRKQKKKFVELLARFGVE